LQQAAKEAGIDLKNPSQAIDDITHPRLFPDFEWHSSGKLTHQVAAAAMAAQSLVPKSSSSAGLTETKCWTGVSAAMISTSREIPQKMQASPFFVLPRVEPDVIRYGKRPRPLEADALLVEYMGGTARPPYVPPELIKRDSTADSTGGAGSVLTSSTRRKSLDELAAEEAANKKTKNNNSGNSATTGGGAGDGDDDDEDAVGANLSDLEQEQDDEEGDVDYTQNYYASDEDTDVGDVDGGEEAVF
jgi:hypothetical protein